MPDKQPLKRKSSFAKFKEKLPLEKVKVERSFIVNQDMFGHTIALNFDQNGSDHKTFIGGVMSILIKIVLFAYIMTKAVIWLFVGDPKLNTLAYGIKLDEEPQTLFNETEVTVFHVLSNQIPGSSGSRMDVNDKTSYSRFLDMYYQ